MSRYVKSDLIAGSLLTLLVLLGLFPYIFMLLVSLKDNIQFFHQYWLPTVPFHLENYTAAWSQISRYILNSLLVAAASILGVLLFSSVAAFVFARYRFPGRNLLFVMVVSLLMIPPIASLIPLFLLIKNMDLLNTRWGLILPYIANGMILGTFLMRTFFEQVPDEIFEAARMDGASGFGLYWRIMLPLSGPILVTVTMVTLINVWNDYFWPLVTISDDSLRTVSIGLAFFQGQNITQWGPLFAGYTIASLPLLIVFLFASRYFVAGLTAGSGGEVK